MKCKTGFITTKDDLTKKQIPFFVKFRSQDVVVTDAVDIEEYMVKTSNLYELVDVKHVNEYSMYHYRTETKTQSGKWNTEVVFGNVLVADITYIFYKDGRLEVYGNARTRAYQITDPMCKNRSSVVGVRVPLPYGFTKEWETKNTTSTLGGKPNLTELYKVSYFVNNSPESSSTENHADQYCNVINNYLGLYKVTCADLTPADNGKLRYVIESTTSDNISGTTADVSFNIKSFFRK